MAERSRILIVDDHQIVRNGVRLTLQSQPWAEVCGEAGTGREAIAAITALAPDIVLMDFNLPDVNGLEVMRAVARERPETKVLVFSMDVADSDLRQLIDLGAHGCVFKANATSELLRALEGVRNGKRHIPDRLLRAKSGMQEKKESPAEADPMNLITRRERQVLALLAMGRSNKETASELGISIKTAETHRARIMRKLRLRTFAEMVQLAIRSGLIKL